MLRPFTTEAAMMRGLIIQQSTLSLVRAILVLGAVVASRLARAAKILRHRRDLELLAELDDRMLKDIGLNRSDLRFALSEPFWRDPGAALIGRVGQRGIGKRRPASVPSVASAAAGGELRTAFAPRHAPRRAA